MTNQVEQTRKTINPMIVVAVIAGVLLAGGLALFASKDTKTQSAKLEGTPTVTSTIISPSPQAKIYALDEVAQHSSETDCWMAIEGKVYDVTKFVSKHPGGKAILGGCGKDATKLFNERPTNNKGPHPAQAKELLKGFYIGDLKLSN